jgi:hypothetical protein
LECVLIDPEIPESTPELPIAFDFQGLDIWFLCEPTRRTCHLRHVIVAIDTAEYFLWGQVGDQEGYWLYFPIYLSDKRPVSSIIHAQAT